jgi:hypothetical protein
VQPVAAFSSTFSSGVNKKSGPLVLAGGWPFVWIEIRSTHTWHDKDKSYRAMGPFRSGIHMINQSATLREQLIFGRSDGHNTMTVRFFFKSLDKLLSRSCFIRRFGTAVGAIIHCILSRRFIIVVVSGLDHGRVVRAERTVMEKCPAPPQQNAIGVLAEATDPGGTFLRVQCCCLTTC